MNEVTLSNLLRIYSGPIVSVATLIFALAALPAFLLEGWWLACLFGGAAILTPAYFYRDLSYWVKTRRGEEAALRGDYVQAEALFRDAKACSENFARNDWRRVIILDGLVRIARAQGNYDDAEAFGLEGLDAAEKVSGIEHVNWMGTALLMASVYMDIAQYAKADSLLQECAPRLEKLPPTIGDWLHECLLLQGRWWSEQGRYQQAEPFFVRAHEIMPKDMKEKNARRIYGALELTEIYSRRNKTAEAELLIEQIKKEFEQTGEKDSALMMRCLDLEAGIRLVQGRLEEAEMLQRQALTLGEKLAGPNMPILANGSNQLGAILKAEGKLVEAEASIRIALRLREEYLAPEHPSVAEVLENLADVLFKMRRSEEAELHSNRAGHIRALHAPFRVP